MRATNKELKAISSLTANPEFQVYMEYIDRWLIDEVKDCITVKEPAQCQGRAQVLTEIKATIAKARESVQSRVAKRALSSVASENAF